MNAINYYIFVLNNVILILKYTKMKNVLTILFLTMVTISASAQYQHKQFNGMWHSERIEPLGNGTFGTRTFSFKDKAWEIKFILYLDSLKKQPVFMFRATGDYEFQGASPTLSKTQNARFNFQKKYVTLLTDNADVIKNFGFASCQLTKDREADITETGCSFLPSKAAYGQEFDLFSEKNGKLYLGARSNDMSSEDKRPTALGAPLVKK